MNHRAALWLGTASAIDYLTQMLLPALLVRTLSPADFGGYRLLWMSAQTAVLVLSLNMALNLIYLAPRHPLARRGAVLGNALAYLSIVGLLGAALAAPLLRAVAGASLEHVLPQWALASFVGVWMISLPFDQIGVVAGRPRAQAAFTLVQTALRIVLLGSAALWTHSLAGVAIGMIALACFRLCIALAFSVGSGAFPNLSIDRSLAWSQLRYGLGFGLGASLFALRSQADGWIAASLFDPAAVATISIALAIVPVIGVVRQAFTSATVSDVAMLIATHRLSDALALNRRANLATALLLLPLIGAFVAIAPEAIAWVYTRTYAAAALPARLYAVAYVVCVLDMSTVVQALGDGRFVMRSGAVLLTIGALATFAAAKLWGLPGIALGSLAALWLGAAWNMQHVAARCRLSFITMQPWREIGLLVALAALAAWVSSRSLPYFTELSPLLRLLSGACVFAFIYLASVMSLPTARNLYLNHWHRRRANQLQLAPSHS